MFVIFCACGLLLAVSEAALVREIRGDDEQREEEERENSFPEVDDVGSNASQNYHQPHVGEHARRRRHEKHLHS